MTHEKAAQKFLATIEEAFEKDPTFLQEDNYGDYLEVCELLGYKPDYKIIEFYEAYLTA